MAKEPERTRGHKHMVLEDSGLRNEKPTKDTGHPGQYDKGINAQPQTKYTKHRPYGWNLANPHQQYQRWDKPVNGQTDHWEKTPAVYYLLLEYLLTTPNWDELDENNDDADGIKCEKPNAKSICHDLFHDHLTSQNVFEDLG